MCRGVVSIPNCTRINNAPVPALWIRLRWLVVVIERDLARHRCAIGTSAVHSLESIGNVVASFRRKVEVEHRTVPCLCLDDIAQKCDGVTERCCDVVQKIIIGGTVKVCYLDGIALEKGSPAMRERCRASTAWISHVEQPIRLAYE